MAEKYVAHGAPLTPFEKELLQILAEECSEVAIAASKIIRFGREDYPPTSDEVEAKYAGKSNIEFMSLELGDFNMMLRLCQRAGLVDNGAVMEGARRKLEKLRRYMQTTPPDGFNL